MRVILKLIVLPTCFALVACQDAKSNTENTRDIEPALVEAQIDSNPDKSEYVHVSPEPSWAKTSDLKPLPDNVSGLAFLRRNDLLIHLDKTGQYTYHSQRVKLLDSRALNVGNVALSWNPAAGEAIVHRLLIHREGSVMDILANNKFDVIRREDQLELAMLNGYLTAVLQVPDLRVGDELELAYTIPSHDPTLGNNSSGLIGLGSAPLGGSYSLGISWASTQKPSIQFSKDFAGLERRTKRAISVSLENPQMLSPPKDAPPRYNWQRVIEYSDFKTWADVSQQFNNLYVKASQFSVDSEIMQEVKRIASTHSGELERTKSALELVQQQVRYIYVGLNGGNIKPATADETWRRRYGDCKGKSTLLLAILRELDIDAELVMANNSGGDDGFDDRLPSPALFDHILLRVKINGTQYWLDPTLPVVIEPSQRPFLSYRWVLPLSSNGSTLEPVPQEAFALPQEMGLMEIDARAGFDQPALKVRTIVQRGIEGLAQYMQYSALTSEQLEASFRNSLVGTSDWDVIEDVSNHYDINTQANILTITGRGAVDWDDEGNGSYDFTLPGGGFSPPTRRQRTSDDDNGAPYYSAASYSCYVTTVRLPEETNLKNWGFNTVYKTKLFGRLYYRMMERRNDGTIRMVRSSRVEEQEISPDHARRDNDRIDDFDNSMARIVYDPHRFITPRGVLLSVPATYEIDWTSPTAPCLLDVVTKGLAD